ncbi:hypothetical protein PR202_gb08967 [Eleusine coracana subsp. coracana]|uniref:Uncharacterized protein n=1 Tax=Eleusine coracana subsp. coracana TaxID=191504 RepID=A0AAV5EFZ8_ELECO|nr:hypothetical protein PR202_gb08967 [Eleusine coracana subsp. coracana]
MESIVKEREDRKEPLGENKAVMGDDTSLFYSDVMPLLVNEEPTVGEDAYVWFGSVFPLACDLVNARFTFEALTTTTASRLHYPAYDRFMKEMDKSEPFVLEFPEVKDEAKEVTAANVAVDGMKGEGITDRATAFLYWWV